MGRMRKAYYTLDELVAVWGFPDADLRYVIENDLLVLSVRIVGHMMEFGEYDETPEGESFAILQECRCHDGLVDLLKRDAIEVFRRDIAQPRHFALPTGGYACLLRETESITVGRSDLLVRSERRARFETDVLPSLEAPQVSDSQFKSFRHRGKHYAFTPTQARVLGYLRAAALKGEPWQSGKAALAAAGSSFVKIGDVFKRRPEWRTIVEHDGRGAYRLSEDLLRQTLD